MPRVFLIHIERFHKALVTELQRRGVEIAYICGAPSRLASLPPLPNTTLHSLWDALRGRPPARLMGEDKVSCPPDRALVEALLPYEPNTLQMLERINYDNRRAHELRMFYLRYVAYWQGVLEFFQPDAVIFQSSPHMGFDYVLYGLCQVRGIRTLIVERTCLPDRLILVERLDRMPCPPVRTTEAGPENGQGSGSEEVPLEAVKAEENYYDLRNRMKNKIDTWSGSRGGLMVGRAMLGHTKAFFHGLFRNSPRLFKRVDFASSSYALSEQMPRAITHLWRLFVSGIRRDQLRWLYESHAREPEQAGNYVYFPLQLQPERTSNPMGGIFSDQLFALDILVHAVPKGWEIYVKEHPRQIGGTDVIKFRLGRSKLFYEKLTSYDRKKVRLISPTEPSDKLVEGSRCVATITGTSGWEAVQKRIPAIVFGFPWYLHCPGVYAVDSVESCARILTGIASRKIMVNLDAVKNYVDWLSCTATSKGYFSDVFAGSIPPEENAKSYADAITNSLSEARSREVKG